MLSWGGNITSATDCIWRGKMAPRRLWFWNKNTRADTNLYEDEGKLLEVSLILTGNKTQTEEDEMRVPQTEHTCRKCVKRHTPTAGNNMLHDRHMLRWDAEIWLLPCETTRQQLNISPLSTPSSEGLLFWNLKLAGTCAWESGFYFETFFLLRGTILFWHSADPSWTAFFLKNQLFPFLSFPFLSFPFLSFHFMEVLLWEELYLLSLVPF